MIRGLSIRTAVLVAILHLPWPLATHAQEPAAPALRVGKVDEIDLEQVRRVVDQARLSAEREERQSAPLQVAIRRITLEEGVLVALENNLDVQIVALSRDAQEVQIPIAEARFDPLIGAGAFASRDSEEDVDRPNPTVDVDTLSGVGFVRKELSTGGSLLFETGLLRVVNQDPDLDPTDPKDPAGDRTYEPTLTVELRQPLLRGGRTFVARRQILDAEYEYEVLEAQLRSQLLNVTARAKEAYHNAVLAERLIEVTQAAVARSERLVEASQALFGARRATKRDVLSAEIRLADDRARLALRRGELERAQNTLRDVLGLPINVAAETTEKTVPLRPIELRLARWIETALKNRPEILEIKTRLEQSDLAVRVAENGVLPRLDLVSRLSRRQQSTSYSRAYRRLHSGGWFAGLEFEIPFGNRAALEGLRRARIDAARIRRELANQMRIVELEVRAEEIELRESLEELEAQITKFEQARSKVEVALARYQRGLSDNQDVTDGQEELLDAEEALLSAVVSYSNGLARLEARVAGPI